MAENKITHAFYAGNIITEEDIYKERDDRKYRGNIYCPECHQAKLTVRGTKKNKELVLIKGTEHHENCSYKYRNATFKQARLVYNEAETYNVNKVFTKIFTTLFKSDDKVVPAGGVFNCPISQKSEKPKFRKVLIPLTHVEKITKDNLNQEQFFYGKVRYEISKLQDGNYLLKVLAPKSSFQYFTIEISAKSYKYIPSKIKNPNRKSQKGVYFLYFGKLTEDRRKFKSSKLRSANYLKTYLPHDDSEKDARKPKLNMQQLKLLKTKYKK